MIRKITFCIASISIMALLASCSTLDGLTLNDELTDLEKIQLIERGRKFIILVNHMNISPADKRIVQKTLPKFSADYTGYKSGVVRMVWKISPSYSIRILLKGDLLDKACPIRMSISRFRI